MLTFAPALLTVLAQDSVRVDRWLCAARVFKSRTLAHKACNSGRVRVNGVAVKPSAPVRVGDQVSADAPRGPLLLEVLDLAEKRLAAPRARMLYADHSPPAAARDDFLVQPISRKGRPTKADRRALELLRRR
jgi:ribosome-associated heat shock protein Hsp15